MKRHYLAYGSNLHPLRIQERVPSANLVATVQIPGYRIVFNKRSDVDASGKANLIRDGDETVCHGAVYQIEAGEKPLLDACEGLGLGYLEKNMRVSVEGSPLDCFTYLASQSHIDDSLKPLDWYLRLVAEGASYHRFPGKYVEAIRQVGADPDENQERREKMEFLLDRIGKFRGS